MKEYKFKSLSEMMDMVKELGYKETDDPAAVYEITGTPLESIWPSEGVEYNDGHHWPGTYRALGFGPNRSTPWGYLPLHIILLREDIAARLEVGSKPSKEEQTPMKPKINLFPPGWKPAPGFEDPREPSDRSDRAKHYWEK